MIAFSLSWVFGFGLQAKGGRKKLPSWEEIFSCLKEVKGCKGSVTLDLLTDTDIGPQSLQVLSDNCKYVISLGEDNGTEYFVRSYTNISLAGIELEVLGDVWDGVLVCTDFNDVEKIFKQFFLAGDVDKKLLN